jgi:tight adherence protein B
MSPVFIFVVLLTLSFGVLLYFLRPTPVESAVKRQLASIEGNRTLSSAGTTILKDTVANPAPWLDNLMNQAPGSTALSLLIRQSGKKWPASYVIVGSVMAAIVVWWMAAAVAGNTLVSFLLGAAAGLAPYMYLYVVREIRFNKCDSLLPEAIDLMVRALRAGHAVPAVMEMIGQEVPEPLGSEFRTLHEEQSLGLPTREAILNLVERVPRDDLRFLATAILVQGETGGNLTQILDKTAAVMRERVRLRGQLRIYTAQGRITGWILCGMPFLMFALISMVNPGYERILLTDPLGIHLIYAGLIMMVIGVLIVRKIIDIKV